MDDSKPQSKPLFIYDGECNFCMYWVDYWKKLVGDRVTFKPYQEESYNHPSIPLESFEKAVQYIAQDGTISSGAKATFNMLSHVKSKKIWLWLYATIPGFAWLAEYVYQFTSTHRDSSYKACKLIWGQQIVNSEYNIASWLFVRGAGILFLIAFISIGTQILGLIGSQGISPLNNLITVANQELGIERYYAFPMLFWLNHSDIMLRLICLVGILSSVLLMIGLYQRVNLIILYVCYLSLITAGQIFMAFQWDMLLLEVALIGFVLCCHRNIGIWLIWWLAFRFIFAGGMVKIMSGDLSWWDLTALNYHFLTQPLPTPFAWYAAKLPDIILKFATLLTLIIELLIVFFIFFPRRLRMLAAWSILFLQTMILITGNYNFFNLTAMLLCIPLFDDTALSKIMPNVMISSIANTTSWPTPKYYLTLFATLFAVFTVLLSIVDFAARFGVQTPRGATRIASLASPLHLVSTYGPFATITKERHEILIEGSLDEENWKSYHFKFKPGQLNRPPLWNIPLQPRLDWQMWFAALGPVQASPWFLNFLQRLLEGSPTVLNLLEDNPFPGKAPKHIRAQMYNYTFSTVEERAKYGDWWDRNYLDVYVPSVQLLNKSENR